MTTATNGITLILGLMLLAGSMASDRSLRPPAGARSAMELLAGKQSRKLRHASIDRATSKAASGARPVGSGRI